MFKKHTVIIIIVTALLIVSVVSNIFTHKKVEKYESAVDSALSFFISHYRIDSIHRSLAYQITEEKLHFVQDGRFNNYNQRNFQELSIMHRELTLLYGPLISYDDYNIRSMAENSLFNMFVDFSIFFDYLEKNYYDSIIPSDGELYLNFSDLTEEMLNAIYIIEEISGGLGAIKSKSFENTSRQRVLEDYMKQSSEYFFSPEVQKKKEMIENLNKVLIAQSSPESVNN